MTRMPADDRSGRSEHDDDLYEEAPRSIFAATWFRALLILAVVVAVGAVSVPYIIDAVNPVLKPKLASRATPPPAPSPAAVAPSPAAVPPTASAPATVPPAGPATVPTSPPSVAPPPAAKAPDKPLAPSDRSVVADKPASVATVPAETTARPEQKSERTAALTPAAPAAPRAVRSATAPSGKWWVQVGAYRNEATAKKVAARLREQNYTTVEQSVRGTAPRATKATAGDAAAPPATSARAGADQYDVFVAGMSADELNTRLGAKGLTAEESGTGALVKPSLPLRDAVALSKELAVDGLKVQVRRAGAASEPMARAADTPAAPATSEGDTLYRVRVGAFADRETAVATLKELEAKGYKPFIARGGS